MLPNNGLMVPRAGDAKGRLASSIKEFQTEEENRKQFAQQEAEVEAMKPKLTGSSLQQAEYETAKRNLAYEKARSANKKSKTLPIEAGQEEVVKDGQEEVVKTDSEKKLAKQEAKSRAAEAVVRLDEQIKGLETTIKENPNNVEAKQKLEMAKGSRADFAKIAGGGDRGSAISDRGNITVEQNRSLLKKWGYTQGEGFKDADSEAGYKAEIKKIKEENKVKSQSLESKKQEASPKTEIQKTVEAVGASDLEKTRTNIISDLPNKLKEIFVSTSVIDEEDKKIRAEDWDKMERGEKPSREYKMTPDAAVSGTIQDKWDSKQRESLIPFDIEKFKKLRRNQDIALELATAEEMYGTKLAPTTRVGSWTPKEGDPLGSIAWDVTTIPTGKPKASKDIKEDWVNDPEWIKKNISPYLTPTATAAPGGGTQKAIAPNVEPEQKAVQQGDSQSLSSILGSVNQILQYISNPDSSGTTKDQIAKLGSSSSSSSTSASTSNVNVSTPINISVGNGADSGAAENAANQIAQLVSQAFSQLEPQIRKIATNAATLAAGKATGNLPPPTQGMFA